MIYTDDPGPVHDDPIVGQLWHGTGGHTYYCDSYDSRYGYWMTPVNESVGSEHPPKRINVSERAIHRTFHIVSRTRPYVWPETPDTGSF